MLPIRWGKQNRREREGRIPELACWKSRIAPIPSATEDPRLRTTEKNFSLCVCVCVVLNYWCAKGEVDKRGTAERKAEPSASQHKNKVTNDTKEQGGCYKLPFVFVFFFCFVNENLKNPFCCFTAHPYPSCAVPPLPRRRLRAWPAFPREATRHRESYR